MKNLFGFAAPALAALLLSGCYEVPVTGRRAMNIRDDKEVTKMSIAMFDDMKSHYKPSRDRESSHAQAQKRAASASIGDFHLGHARR